MEIKIYNVIYWKLYGKELEPQSCDHIYHTKLKDAKNCMSTIRERRDIKNRQYFEVIIFPNTLEYFIKEERKYQIELEQKITELEWILRENNINFDDKIA